MENLSCSYTQFVWKFFCNVLKLSNSASDFAYSYVMSVKSHAPKAQRTAQKRINSVQLLCINFQGRVLDFLFVAYYSYLFKKKWAR
jgi:hypothetical protein